MEIFKVCTKCKLEKPTTEEYFYKKPGGKDGLNSICKECCSAYQKKKVSDVVALDKKICKNCNKEFPATTEYFYNRKASKDGLGYVCKPCKKILDIEYNINNKEKVRNMKKEYLKNNEKMNNYYQQYRNSHKEKVKEYNTFYNKENKETLNKSRSKYREANRKMINSQKREHYNKNRERLLEICKIYRQTHKEDKKLYFKNYAKSEHGKTIIKHIRQNRRAKIKKLIYTLSIEQWQECLSYFNNECAYCGGKSTLAQEHIIPVAKGGNYVKQNIIPSCQSCNSSKRDSDMEAWYKKQTFYSESKFKKICKWSNIKNNEQQLSIL